MNVKTSAQLTLIIMLVTILVTQLLLSDKLTHIVDSDVENASLAPVSLSPSTKPTDRQVLILVDLCRLVCGLKPFKVAKI